MRNRCFSQANFSSFMFFDSYSPAPAPLTPFTTQKTLELMFLGGEWGWLNKEQLNWDPFLWPWLGFLFGVFFVFFKQVSFSPLKSHTNVWIYNVAYTNVWFCFGFLASLERINDNGENYLTRYWFLLQHNSLTCLLVCAPFIVSSLDGILMGNIGTCREMTPWSLVCKPFSHRS